MSAPAPNPIAIVPLFDVALEMLIPLPSAVTLRSPIAIPRDPAQAPAPIATPPAASAEAPTAVEFPVVEAFRPTVTPLTATAPEPNAVPPMEVLVALVPIATC